MTTTATMRAIGVLGGTGPAEALIVEERERPEISPGEILIEVVAAGVNRPDISQREGNYPPPPGASDVIGLEVAGRVAAVGTGAPRWKVGDRVTALLPGGGYAQYARVDARHALPIPDDVSFEQAAVLPETVFTVWINMFENARLKAGETVLVHGANSGIGVTAIQMAKAAGATVIATCRGAWKAQKALELGADHAVDVSARDFVAVAQELGGVDVVLDMVGGSYFPRNVAALKPDGRLAQIALLDGGKVELDLMQLLFKRLTVVGSTLRARPADEKARLAAAIEDHVWPWVQSGAVRPPVDRTFALGEACEAHRHLENGSQFGKVVLMP
ncbi:NAD(P)H-quinone oxidoreductase (plasmid) [Novosphingobium resinovorum]|uniref:NAD(P)H-quinone oxidoreductase n=1 Tax=Novosphingobium TaxID=165696 RepID=UPI001B3C80FF|nr:MULTISPECIES: NAD(P)H-quinone oxidoreductase [Novosphingobium]WJM29917.1 NAD(P)H-quinone oxidoreductase [Novosphingobium resinovorum]